MGQRALRLFTCFGAVAVATFMAYRLVPVNATTAGLGYLLLVLIVADRWGFSEAAFSSVFATLAFKFFFLPPVGALTIADPQNWIALFTFLAASLIASRLSANAKRRAVDAIERQRQTERLNTFSRAIVLTTRDEPFQKQFIRKLAETFPLTAAVLYDRRTGEFYRASPSDFEGLDDQLRDAALHDASFRDGQADRTITAIRLGSEPIASLALQGADMPDSVLQGVANLASAGLERARVQELEREFDAVQHSELLRTTLIDTMGRLIDTMAHEFEIPLTLIKEAATSVLAGHGHFFEGARGQLTIADEEPEHLKELRKRVLSILLQLLARDAYRDGETAGMFFPMAQSMGFHFLPVHYYSPVPNTSELPDKTWSHRFDQIPGWSLNRDGQLQLLEKLARWGPEMAGTPADRNPADPPHLYFWNNSKFNPTDGVVYHSMIRHFKPRQILEIGSGYSTMVAARAALLNESTRLGCIEPFPVDDLRQGIPGVERLIESPLQDVSVALFEDLETNDILFVDSSHVSKVGSDVNYVVFEILPRLKPGVVVHIHDIFLPEDYPREWIVDHHLFWNEQYLLLAFLLFNNAFEVLFASHYMGAYEKEALERAYPYLPNYGGCSLWIRRKGLSG